MTTTASSWKTLILLTAFLVGRSFAGWIPDCRPDDPLDVVIAVDDKILDNPFPKIEQPMINQNSMLKLAVFNQRIPTCMYAGRCAARIGALDVKPSELSKKSGEVFVTGYRDDGDPANENIMMRDTAFMMLAAFETAQWRKNSIRILVLYRQTEMRTKDRGSDGICLGRAPTVTSYTDQCTKTVVASMLDIAKSAIANNVPTIIYAPSNLSDLTAYQAALGQLGVGGGYVWSLAGYTPQRFVDRVVDAIFIKEHEFRCNSRRLLSPDAVAEIEGTLKDYDDDEEEKEKKNRREEEESSAASQAAFLQFTAAGQRGAGRLTN